MDYSRFEKAIVKAQLTELESRAMGETEIRFNPYHDPKNGRFISASGISSHSGYYYSKGGKSAYVVNSTYDKKNR